VSKVEEGIYSIMCLTASAKGQAGINQDVEETPQLIEKHSKEVTEYFKQTSPMHTLTHINKSYLYTPLIHLPITSVLGIGSGYLEYHRLPYEKYTGNTNK
jgi:hypothetical protein